MVKFLSKAGAKADVKDAGGLSAMLWVKCHNSMRLINLLEQEAK